MLENADKPFPKEKEISKGMKIKEKICSKSY
jgi:hypothetical protein